jgi:hypothetical protein
VLATLLAVAALPILDRSPFEAGVLDTLLRFDLSLAFAGLGLALAASPRRHRLAANLVLVVCGIGAGAIIGVRLAAAIEDDSGAALYGLLAGPLLCVVTGVALAAPAAIRVWAHPPAALAAGVALGLPIVADSMSRAQVEFTAGALSSGIGLILAPLLLLWPFVRSGATIAGRIFGAWLIAIGLMLLTVELIK